MLIEVGHLDIRVRLELALQCTSIARNSTKLVVRANNGKVAAPVPLMEGAVHECERGHQYFLATTFPHRIELYIASMHASLPHSNKITGIQAPKDPDCRLSARSPKAREITSPK
jgi:hypothetical protein